MMNRSSFLKAVLIPLLIFLSNTSSVVKSQGADGLVIYTPTTLSTCQSTDITWDHAANGKIYLSVVPGGKPEAKALVRFKEMDASIKSLPWIVNLPAGTSVTIMGTDSSGSITGSAAVTIKEGKDTSCIGKEQSSQDDSKNTSSPSNDGGAINQWTSSSQWTNSGANSTTSEPSTSSHNSSTSTDSNKSISQVKTPSSNGAANMTSPTTPKGDTKNSTLTPSSKLPTSLTSSIDKHSTSSASRLLHLNQEQVMLSASGIFASILLTMVVLP